jgi:HPt (histidine-containing phosphotransfer) domain-containing protein
VATALAAVPGLVAPPRPAPSIDGTPGFARPTTLPAASPRVLDGQAGRARAGGDVARYRSQLAAFARAHRGDARQFAALLAAGRRSEARERLRALADAASALALPALARATSIIDDALRNGRPVPPSRLHELGTTLAETVTAAEAASAETAPAPNPLAAIGDGADRAQLWQHFDDALARGDIVALDLFERLAHGRDGAAWQALRDALLVLDYARAAEIRPRVR